MGTYETIISQNKAFIDETWQKIAEKMLVVAPRNANKLPSMSKNGVYNDHSEDMPDAWTNGFWPGMMWLMYAGTGNDMYKDIAIHGEELLEKGAEDFDLLYHDVGFMWHISSGAHYRLTGDKKPKSRAMYMAASLSSRYNMNTGCIRAFQESERESMVIIDSMMNLPLLYWASEQTNDPRFSLVAQSHADTCIKNHLRADGSVHHILDYDIRTGEMIGIHKGQGTGESDSAWTRGTAWALYGYTLSYIHTHKAEYLDVAKNVAHFFMANVSQNDYIPQYDFRQSYESNDVDSSAGAIAACGLIELAKIVPENEKAMYLNCAIKMMKALTEKYADLTTNEDALLRGVAASPVVLDVTNVFGDYYYLEAIYKLKGFEPMFW